MTNPTKKAEGTATEAHRAQGEIGEIAEADDDAAETFDAAKVNAKEIFEGARAKQEEDFIRLGKPE